MGSSLHKSTLREKQEVAVVLPQVLASNSSTEKSSTQMPELPRSEETKIKSPISFFIDQIKDLAYNSPKFIEASAYLIGTAITLCATPVVMLWSKKGYLETKDSILTPFVEFGRNTCNKYTWCGSLLGNDREFITITDSQVKDNLNPFKWMGDSILSSVMHTIDWGRATGTRLIYNFVTKQNINAEEFRALESENPLLRTTKFVSDLLKAGVSLLVLKKLGAKSTIDELIKPITVAAGMSAANVIGEKWQEDKSCLSVDTIENTVAGTANSLIFMAGMRYSAHSWVNSAQTKKVYQSRSEQAQRVVENIDLIDSIPDLVKALHKARNELLDDNNYKNKNVWNHLGHLLTASSAAMDAGELNLSGVSNYKTEVKLNTSEKLQTDALKMRLINYGLEHRTAQERVIFSASCAKHFSQEGDQSWTQVFADTLSGINALSEPQKVSVISDLAETIIYAGNSNLALEKHAALLLQEIESLNQPVFKAQALIHYARILCSISKDRFSGSLEEVISSFISTSKEITNTEHNDKTKIELLESFRDVLVKVRYQLPDHSIESTKAVLSFINHFENKTFQLKAHIVYLELLACLGNIQVDKTVSRYTDWIIKETLALSNPFEKAARLAELAKMLQRMSPRLAHVANTVYKVINSERHKSSDPRFKNQLVFALLGLRHSYKRAFSAESTQYLFAELIHDIGKLENDAEKKDHCIELCKFFSLSKIEINPKVLKQISTQIAEIKHFAFKLQARIAFLHFATGPEQLNTELLNTARDISKVDSDQERKKLFAMLTTLISERHRDIKDIAPVFKEIFRATREFKSDTEKSETINAALICLSSMTENKELDFLLFCEQSLELAQQIKEEGKDDFNRIKILKNISPLLSQMRIENMGDFFSRYCQILTADLDIEISEFKYQKISLAAARYIDLLLQFGRIPEASSAFIKYRQYIKGEDLISLYHNLTTRGDTQLDDVKLNEVISSLKLRDLISLGLVYPKFTLSTLIRIEELKKSINTELKVQIANIKSQFPPAEAHQQITSIKEEIENRIIGSYLRGRPIHNARALLEQIEIVLLCGFLESRASKAQDTEQFFSMIKPKSTEIATRRVKTETGEFTHLDIRRWDRLSVYIFLIGVANYDYEQVSSTVSLFASKGEERKFRQIIVEQLKGATDRISKKDIGLDEREAMIVRSLRVLIESDNEKGKNRAVKWLTSGLLDPKRTEYLIKKLFHMGYWDYNLGAYLRQKLDAHKHNPELLDKEKERIYNTFNAIIKLGFAPEIEIYKLLEEGNDILNGKTLDERVSQVQSSVSKFKDRSFKELISILTNQREAIIYYLQHAADWRYDIVRDFTSKKFYQMICKIHDYSFNMRGVSKFLKSLTSSGYTVHEAFDICRQLINGQPPLSSQELEFPLDLSTTGLGLTREFLDKSTEETFATQLHQLVCNLAIGNRPKKIQGMPHITDLDLAMSLNGNPIFLELSLLLGDISGITSIDKLFEALEAYKKKDKVRSSYSRLELMRAFLADRVSSLLKSTDFFEDPLVKEWLVHFENLIKNAETHQVEVKENTHEQFTVRFLDKSRELVAAIRFKDGVYSCLNSQGEKFFDTVSVMMKDPLCLMLDIRKHGSNKIFGSVGLRIGIDKNSQRPVLLIQGLYFENKTPSFINGILDLIEQQIARKIRAKKIVLATILGGGLPFAPRGYKANSKALFFEIEGTCGVEGSTGYDDIGSINDSNFTFNKPGFIKELD